MVRKADGSKVTAGTNSSGKGLRKVRELSGTRPTQKDGLGRDSQPAMNRKIPREREPDVIGFWEPLGYSGPGVPRKRRRF